MVQNAIIAQKQEIELKINENYVERTAKAAGIGSSLIKVIVGPRRSGKSFYAIHLLSKLGPYGYANFDDERLTDVKNYDDIIASLKTTYNNPKNILFDEIQNLPKWELFVNRLQRQGYNLFITGSNSNLLSKELATHLTGRHVQINIFPFSFREYLEACKIKEGRKEFTSSEIKEKLSSYATYGGYPEPLLKNLEYKDYLSMLFNSIVYKDIVKRHKIRFASQVEDLAYHLISNITNEYSFNSLSKIAKIKSAHTIQKYLSCLEEAFIFFSISRFSFKAKEQLTSNKKAYCYDNGVIYSKAFSTSPNSGRLYENIVAIELKKREMDNAIYVYYWKNVQQEEVDFVIKNGLRIEGLIQVCYDISNIKTKEREVRALLKAGRELKCDNLIIITDDYETEENAEWFGIKGKIKYIPLWKWLLAARR